MRRILLSCRCSSLVSLPRDAAFVTDKMAKAGETEANRGRVRFCLGCFLKVDRLLHHLELFIIGRDTVTLQKYLVKIIMEFPYAVVKWLTLCCSDSTPWRCEAPVSVS